MKSLCQVVSSDQVYSLNLSGDHSGVVERLRPMLECESDTNSQVKLLGLCSDVCVSSPMPASFC